MQTAEARNPRGARAHEADIADTDLAPIERVYRVFAPLDNFKSRSLTLAEALDLIGNLPGSRLWAGRGQ